MKTMNEERAVPSPLCRTLDSDELALAREPCQPFRNKSTTHYRVPGGSTVHCPAVNAAFRLFSVLLLVFLASGCAPISPPYVETNHYILEYPPPAFPDLAPLPVVLHVDRFTVSPVYDTDRIIYRDQAHTRNAYAYHRWRTRPDSLIRDSFLRDLRHSALFQAVLADAIGRGADFLLAGTVEEILEWNREEEWLAVLTISVNLVAREPNGPQGIIFQQTFSARQPAARKDPQAVVEAMSQAMAELSGEIIRAVHAVIRSPR
jgi:ABC-type uncharacterized transport system auxiliary subunit